MSHKLDSADTIREFLLAGKSTFTLVSTKTGSRFTYRVKRAKGESRPWFVGLLTGPDNTSSYSYLGCIWGSRYSHGRKSRVGSDAISVKAFDWFLRHLDHDALDLVEFWHEGRCGRCGRKLTVPESIEAGIGPECASRMAA